MTLTNNQIAELFRFCEQKYVRYYDLQVELVDHLAERIEEETVTHPELSFDDALAKVYKGFGIFGFAHIVRDKETSLRKQTNKLWLKELVSYFTLPKLLLTISSLLLFYFSGDFFSPDTRKWIIVTLWLIGYVYQTVQLVRFKRSESKKLMLTQYYPVSILCVTMFFFDQLIFLPETINSLIGFSIWGTLALIIQSTLIEVNRGIGQKARKLYPEAFNMA